MVENSDYRVCSEHFVSGKPAKLYDCTSPDWLPTINLGHTKQKKGSDYTRHERAKRRADEQRIREEEDRVLTQQIDVVGFTEIGIILNEVMLQVITEAIEEEATTESAMANVVECIIIFWIM